MSNGLGHRYGFVVRRAVTRGAFLAAMAIVSTAAAGGLIASRSADSAIKVFCDVDEPAIGKQALAIADETWKQGCALFGVDAAPPAVPMELHLYRDVAGYEEACTRLAGGDFKRNLAFAEWSGPSAHVLLQPELAGDAFHRLAPTWQTLRLVAHEAAHLVRFARIPNHRNHPGWFADGSASWLETKVLAAQGLLTTPEQAPRHSTDVVAVQRLLKEAKLPAVEELVSDRTDTLEFNTRYAVRWLFFRFLIEGPRAKPFRAFIVDLRGLGGDGGGTDPKSAGGFVMRAKEALTKRLGDLSKVDAEFRQWLGRLEPEWEEVHTTLETAGDDWSQAAFNVNAIAWRTAPTGRKPWALSGEVTVLAGSAKPQMNLLLGRELLDGGNERFVSIALVPGAGATLFDYDGSRPEAQQWQQLAFGALPDAALGKPLAFRVECTPREKSSSLVLKIGDRNVAEASVDRVLDGAWGLGAQAGSAGIWRGVRQVPPAKR